jgi:dTDP-4-amino-4,6-dideoxy-D-galactose acyltransferase
LKKLSCEEFDAFESIIDTKYFGVASAKVVLKKACMIDQRQKELLDFLQDFEFIVITNKANDSSNNHWLGEKTKAFLTDINIQLNKKVSIGEKYDGGFTVITDNFPENRQIIQIAEGSFKFSRFLNDPYLPVQKAKCIYADMTKNAFRKQGRFFVTIKETEVVSGFLLFSINQVISSSTIELIAIDQNFAGMGIGRSLISAMEHHVAKMGVETIRVGTQLNNINALKFYTSYGFNYCECNSIYHYWPLKP